VVHCDSPVHLCGSTEHNVRTIAQDPTQVALCNHNGWWVFPGQPQDLGARRMRAIVAQELAIASKTYLGPPCGLRLNEFVALSIDRDTSSSDHPIEGGGHGFRAVTSGENDRPLRVIFSLALTTLTLPHGISAAQSGRWPLGSPL
jgi:hypothetical protein